MSDIDDGSSSDSDSSVASSMSTKCLRTPANFEDEDPFVSQIQIPRIASTIAGSDDFAQVGLMGEFSTPRQKRRLSVGPTFKSRLIMQQNHLRKLDLEGVEKAEVET